VKFCCAYPEENCNDPQHFDLSTLPQKRDLPADFKVIQGMPDCEKDIDGHLLKAKNKDPWIFTEV
jgi:hypothetical protein